jgi:hypothetical protein
VAPAAERCSNAVLECPVYRRSAVTGQSKLCGRDVDALERSPGKGEVASSILIGSTIFIGPKADLLPAIVRAYLGTTAPFRLARSIAC